MVFKPVIYSDKRGLVCIRLYIRLCSKTVIGSTTIREIWCERCHLNGFRPESKKSSGRDRLSLPGARFWAFWNCCQGALVRRYACIALAFGDAEKWLWSRPKTNSMNKTKICYMFSKHVFRFSASFIYEQGFRNPGSFISSLLQPYSSVRRAYIHKLTNDRELYGLVLYLSLLTFS